MSYSRAILGGMRREVQVAVDCADPGLLARFWADVLGYRVEDPPPGYPSWSDFSRAVGGAGEEWSAVVDPDGVGPRLLFHRVPEEKTVKNRLHLDVRVGGARGRPKQARRPLVDAEVGRLVSGGATHVRTVEDQTDYFAVMRDPEGNEFCIC
jgi:catechol 2,3-dioxygenase-like lactoylglutathione lyase family enzyme